MQTPVEKVDAKTLVYGNTETFTLPSGFSVTIREQNGNDDDVLTNRVTSEDMSNFDIFIAGIVIETDLPFNVNKRLTVEGARKLLLRDKYFILLKSRINSIGKEISFEYQWGDSREPDNYTEDLTQFVWDYSKPFPQPGDEDYYSDRIKPYAKGAYDSIEITTPSGKELRFNILSGIGEKYLLQLSPEAQTKNQELQARQLEIKGEKGWEKVTNFAVFTTSEMRYLRKIVSELDESVVLGSEVRNPRNPEMFDRFPIMSLRGFFFPEEI